MTCKNCNDLQRENERLKNLLKGNDGMSVLEIRSQFVDLHRDWLGLRKENEQLHKRRERMDLCEECEKKFGKQLGDLFLFDLCEECTTKALLSISLFQDGRRRKENKLSGYTPNNPNTLGKFLRQERLKRGLTGKQLAELTEVAQSRLSQIELGYVHCPSVNILGNLATFLGKTPVELAKMIDNKNENIQLLIANGEVNV